MDRLINIDRRIIFIFIFLGVAIPLLVDIPLPIKPTPTVRSVYDEIERISVEDADRPVLVSFSYGASTVPEMEPMTRAILRHLFSRGRKVVGICLWPEAVGIAQPIMDELAAEFGMEYGTDYAVGETDEPAPLQNGTLYFVRLGAQTSTGEVLGEVASAVPVGNWFNTAKWNNIVLTIGLSVCILFFISIARRKDLFIRRIAGLEALDEALGRATEMGKSVLFVHGLKGMDQIPTIAAVNILGRVAQRTARFDTDLRVANVDPVVMSVSQEVVKEAYLKEGRPDAYRPDSVFMAATEQFSYAAAVAGMMVRERPAAHIMMGYFYAESLLLAETGSTTGAIQIAGTDAYTQLPFFVTTCDYTLMGEELYAASAYLSKEPKLLGSLKGQDVGKALLIGLLFVGTVVASFGVDFLTHLFAAL
jgi:hypothetical protein